MYPQLYRLKRSVFLLIVPCVLILGLSLSACGTNVGTGGPLSSTAPTATPSRAASTPTRTPGGASPTATPNAATGQNTSYGCPSSTVITTPPAAATVVLKQSRNRATVTVHKGETVEVDLSSGLSWHGPLQLAQNLLEMQSPSGYVYPAAKMCVWRFVALASGVVDLSFTGKPVCGAGHACPMYIVAVQFTIEIQ